MHGVAHGVSDLYIYKIFKDDALATSVSNFQSAIADAASKAISAGVKVINHSYGTANRITDQTKSQWASSTSTQIAAYQNLVSNQIINVFAAGNGRKIDIGGVKTDVGWDQPSSPAGLPYYYSELKEYWIVVVAVDTNFRETLWTNRCGVAKEYCIAAPGDSINSVKTGGGYIEKSGTSMAAPHVAGAVAVLIETFPTLSQAQIVDRIINTANPNVGFQQCSIYNHATATCTTYTSGYDDDIFGQGMLDLDAATKPIAVLALSVGGTSLSSSTRYSLDSTRLNLSKAFGQNRNLSNNILKINNLSQQISTTQSIASFDTYDNAIFFLNLSSLTAGSSYTPLGLNQVILKDYEEQSLYEFGILKLSGIVNSSDTKTDQYNFPFKTLNASISLNDFFQIKYNYAEIQDFFFISTKKDARITESLFTYSAFRNPYMGMSGEFEGLEMFLKINDKLKFSLNYTEEGYIQELETNLSERKKEVIFKGFNAHVESEFIDKINLSYLRMEEEGAFLGSKTSGAFRLKDKSVSDIFSAMIEKKINARLAIYASGYYGLTEVNPDTDSLFSDFKTIQSTSWSLGLLNDQVISKNDSLGLVVHQPLRAENGSFNLRLPGYADYKGNIYYKDHAYRLKPNGREINYETFYEIDLNKLTLRLSSIFIDEGGHLNETSLEKVFMLELKGAI
jgi:hypothetical protein